MRGARNEGLVAGSWSSAFVVGHFEHLFQSTRAPAPRNSWRPERAPTCIFSGFDPGRRPLRRACLRWFPATPLAWLHSSSRFQFACISRSKASMNLKMVSLWINNFCKNGSGSQCASKSWRSVLPMNRTEETFSVKRSTLNIQPGAQEQEQGPSNEEPDGWPETMGRVRCQMECDVQAWSFQGFLR